MAIGLCPRCTKRNDCGFRQPGTWVVECPLYDQDQQAMARQLPSQSDEPGEQDAAGGSVPARRRATSRSARARRRPRKAAP